MPPKHHHHRHIPALFHEMELFKDFFDWDLDDLSKFETDSSISLYEDENKIFVEAAMPGIDPKDIEISFEKGILWMKAETKKEEKDVKYHMRAQNCFSYRLPIPSRVDENKEPEATYENGILKVAFEKTKASKPKKIEIKVK